MRGSALLSAAVVVSAHKPGVPLGGCQWKWFNDQSCKDGLQEDRNAPHDIGFPGSAGACLSACEARNGCVAVDYAIKGDGRCVLYHHCNLGTVPPNTPNPFWAAHWNCPGVAQDGVVINPDPLTPEKPAKFYLPLQTPTRLLTCRDFEFYGRATTHVDDTENDQWFNMFQFRIQKQTMVSVNIRDSALQQPKPSTEKKGASHEKEGLVKIAEDKIASILTRAALLVSEKRTNEVLNAAQQQSQKQPGTLSTIAVTVQGVELSSPAKMQAGALNVTVKQDISKHIGNGYAESVAVQHNTVEMEVKSALVTKVVNETKTLQTLHLDMVISNIDASLCTGPLPEIWGIRPMSRSTAKFLIPNWGDKDKSRKQKHAQREVDPSA